MRQPYATIFAGWDDHPIVGRYFKGDEPDWHRLFVDGDSLAPDLDMLSSGEITLLWIGLAFWNGNPTARVADIAKLDRPNRMRVAAAIGQ